MKIKRKNSNVDKSSEVNLHSRFTLSSLDTLLIAGIAGASHGRTMTTIAAMSTLQALNAHAPLVTLEPSGKCGHTVLLSKPSSGKTAIGISNIFTVHGHPQND